jgi:hypothetical protein
MSRTELDDGSRADTYILYDEMGRTQKVLPPKASKKAKDNGWSLSGLGELMYEYVYDAHGNISRKKIPSKDWIDMIYDKLNRPVLVQDGNGRLKNEYYHWTV